ncbi:MAG: acetyl-CoA carboxylase biotin carboxyl carrier protein [Oscillatoriales cyanobacterium C42_A2020_001]|nr:acetyl-CoA carboxylase biotin carboxyl carrier protein [Leptolyngbyaceae cyanobacterium C42_A2020_001]
MSLNLNELRELLEAINQMDIAELTLKSNDFELTVRRGMRMDEQLLAAGMTRVPILDGVAPIPSPPASASTGASTEARVAPDTTSMPSSAALPPTNERRWVEILSPMVGTFYRAPAPDEPPFVDVGERVRVGQTVCIIEAMKLMNEIEAEVGGEIIEILVQNGEPVEYNQPLMRVVPS